MVQLGTVLIDKKSNNCSQLIIGFDTTNSNDEQFNNLITFDKKLTKVVNETKLNFDLSATSLFQYKYKDEVWIIGNEVTNQQFYQFLNRVIKVKSFRQKFINLSTKLFRKQVDDDDLEQIKKKNLLLYNFDVITNKLKLIETKDPPNNTIGFSSCKFDSTNLLISPGYKFVEGTVDTNFYKFDMESKRFININLNFTSNFGFYNQLICDGTSKYLLGGVTDKFQLTKLDQIFQLNINKGLIQAKSIELKGNVPKPRLFASYLSLNKEQLLMYGGMDSKGKVKNDMRVLDLQSFKWSDPIYLDQKSMGAQLVYKNETLFVFGSSTSDSYLPSSFDLKANFQLSKRELITQSTTEHSRTTFNFKDPKNLPLLILVPLAVVLLILIIFTTIYKIRSHYKKKRYQSTYDPNLETSLLQRNNSSSTLSMSSSTSILDRNEIFEEPTTINCQTTTDDESSESEHSTELNRFSKTRTSIRSNDPLFMRRRRKLDSSSNSTTFNPESNSNESSTSNNSSEDLSDVVVIDQQTLPNKNQGNEILHRDVSHLKQKSIPVELYSPGLDSSKSVLESFSVAKVNRVNLELNSKPSLISMENSSSKPPFSEDDRMEANDHFNNF